jgi:hypothetical protein
MACGDGRDRADLVGVFGGGCGLVGWGESRKGDIWRVEIDVPLFDSSLVGWKETAKKEEAGKNRLPSFSLSG